MELQKRFANPDWSTRIGQEQDSRALKKLNQRSSMMMMVAHVTSNGPLFDFQLIGDDPTLLLLRFYQLSPGGRLRWVLRNFAYIAIL